MSVTELVLKACSKKYRRKEGSDDVRWKEIKIDIRGRKLNKEREV
jgi:hypothetical protein